jgi:uncharacterized glyoxalase superfamily protein PhnB
MAREEFQEMNRIFCLLLSVAFLSSFLSTQQEPSQGTPGQPAKKEIRIMQVKRITPVLYVKEIEPCVKFWVERLGFEATAQVPDGDRLGFVILQKGTVEIMYQSFASAAKDAPAVAREIEGGRTFLYLEVDNLQPVIDALKGAAVVVPRRTTFYGADEFGVKDPAGHVVLFAQMAAVTQH